MHVSDRKVRLLSKKQLQSIITRIDKMKLKHKQAERMVMLKIMSDSEGSEDDEDTHPLKVKKMAKKEESSSESSCSDEE